MRNLLAELDRRDRLLSLLGRANLLLAVLLIVAIAVDPRQLLGISVWIKTFAAAAVWLGIGGCLFHQALAGIPLLRFG